MKVTQSVFLAVLISLPPTLCQAQGQTPAPAPAAKAAAAQPAVAQPAVAVPQPQPTAVAGNGPLAKALVEFTICFQTAVDRVAAIIALENGMGRGAQGGNQFMMISAGGLINNPYTDHIKWYEAGYAKGTGWADKVMVVQRINDASKLGFMSLIPAIAGQGAAMVIGEQNLCVKRLNDQLKY